MKSRRIRFSSVFCRRSGFSICRLAGLFSILAILSGCVESLTSSPQPLPWVLQRTSDGRDARAFVQETNSTAFVEQLGIPLGPCHIEVLDLPVQYQQPANEKRLDYVVSAGTKKAELEAQYPVLQDYLSVSRMWVSEEKKTIAFLMCHALGDFILISQDGGAHWSTPLYLGIHRLSEASYEPLADSKLPLVSNEKIQIEVTIWKRDMAKWGSPLFGYEYLWKKWNKYLSIRLGDLIRDSDGDGLTDLFEERILTDPHSADTDGDGLSDGVDNQPLTPLPKKMTDSDAVLLALIADDRGPLIGSIFPSRREPLDFFVLDDHAMARVLTDKGIAHFTEPRSKPIPMDRTSLVVSASDSFPHITGDVRVIVLDQKGFQRYMRKFPEESHFYAGSFDLRFDRSRRSAVLWEFEGITGSTTVLWKKRGLWMSSQREHVICE